MEYQRNIIRYYDNTQLDYRWLWFRKGNRAVHFGYYEDESTSHADALVNLNKVMALKVGISQEDHILDAGCGQGGSSVWLAENYGAAVHGITLVPHQVEIAKQEAGNRGLNDLVRFSVQDYNSTRFEDETFSVIWACESMCHAEHKSDFYREASRLLKPGGRLICADYIRTERPHAPEGESLLQQWLNGWSIRDLDSGKEHRKNAAQHGFRQLEIEDITPYTRPSLYRLYRISKKLWKLGKLLRRLSIRNDVNHGNHRASIRQYEALKEGLWYYGLISATKEI